MFFNQKKIFPNIILPIVIFHLIFFQSACSINSLIAHRTAKVIEVGLPALYAETDLRIAETALESNLKLLEILLKNNPKDESLKLLLAQGYYAYALGFVEDTDPDRAKVFFLRGRNYALQVLQKNKEIEKALKGPASELNLHLNKLNKKYLAPLFWTAVNWGQWIMHSLDNPQAIFDLPKVEAIMNMVLELDENFYFAGAHLFFGSLNSARPVILGGKPKLAKQHFDKAIKLTNGTFLLARFYLARFYAVQTLNKKLFVSSLEKVLNTNLNVLPEYALINQIAKRKAKLWLAKKDELF